MARVVSAGCPREVRLGRSSDCGAWAARVVRVRVRVRVGVRSGRVVSLEHLGPLVRVRVRVRVRARVRVRMS